MILYPKNKSGQLEADLFKNPGPEYRAAPFWSWNTRLDRDQLMRQIDVLEAMGMGGFHIHSRTGLATEYMGNEFMALVRACIERAQQKQMRVWLYDEDRWPSGSAGGRVTHEPAFRAKHLLFTCRPYDGVVGAPVLISRADGARTGTGELLARYQINLSNGYLESYRRLAQDEPNPTDGRVWYAYLETELPSPWFNNQTYVDTLNASAIARFIELTHEKYRAEIGDCFGSVIPAIFTDEPQFVHKQSLAFAESTHDVIIPFTTDFFETFYQVYEQRLDDCLPELFWELPARRPSVTRYRYHDHLAERFSAAYADSIGTWCRQHGIALTGHMMEEPTLQSQASAVGEVMRSYRAFDLPGIDMLCDYREYTTAKQAQSAAHQYGAPGVLSELYGVTNWDFDFVGHKAQGDWQAALGVTVRVHHLALVSLAGEGKRDYPASISYQSTWYKEYPLIETYFARLNTLLTRGQPIVRIAVIHPIESYWLCFGPLEQTRLERNERNTAFQQITEWLLFGLLDFDFIAESLLPSLVSDEPQGAQLIMGQAAYDVIVVPNLRTIRATTLASLERFHLAGGRVIFAGEVPSLVDAEPSDRAHRLAARAESITHTRGQLIMALETVREVDIRLNDGSPADTILHQIRQDDDQRYIFFCNTDKLNAFKDARVRLRGTWSITVYDALNGTTSLLDTVQMNGWTGFTWDFTAHGSLLIALFPVKEAEVSHPPSAGFSRRILTPVGMMIDPVAVTLSEPNVLLLDIAEYRLNDEAWQPVEEVLRLDNLLRTRSGFPLRMEALAQPWTYGDISPAVDRLTLRFQFDTELAVTGAKLALENAAQCAVSLDGQLVNSPVDGWFVDEAIGTIALPHIHAGTHELHVNIPFGAHTNTEACYLLGDFGVEVQGRHARLIHPVRTLTFGDWTQQGLPFYAGNVIYHCEFTCATPTKALHIAFPHFRAPLLNVSLDGGACQPVAFSPFQAALGTLSAGVHHLDVTAFGSRVNTFGTVHNANSRTVWYGPNAWRTDGNDWAYEYQLRPAGILVAPTLLAEQTPSD